MCAGQHHLKRLLAFSTISHVGLFLVGIALLSPEALGGTVIYICGHAGVKSALFLLTGLFINRYESVDEMELHGLGKPSRSLGVLWLVCGVALAGLPPFALALGKGLVEHAGETAGFPWISALFVAAPALTGAAVVRAGLRVYFGCGAPSGTGGVAEHEEPETGRPLGRIPATMLAPILGLICLALALGLWPGLAQSAVNAATTFIDRSGYIAQVLHGAPRSHATAPPVQPWTVQGVALALGSALLACVLAAAAVWADRLPAVTVRWAMRARPAMSWLHRQHSGHIGDYVAWLITGVTVMAALLGLPLL